MFNKFEKWVALASIFLVVGCASSEPEEEHVPEASPVKICPVGSEFDVRLHSALPEDWARGALDALATWDSALKGSFVFKVRITAEVDWDAAPCRLTVFPSPEPMRNWGLFDGARNPGTDRSAYGAIWVNSTKGDYAAAYATVLHELGHFFGLDHNPDINAKSVMWKFITVPGRVGCVDQDKACTIWGCSPSCADKDEWLGNK